MREEGNSLAERVLDEWRIRAQVRREVAKIMDDQEIEVMDGPGDELAIARELILSMEGLDEVLRESVRIPSMQRNCRYDSENKRSGLRKKRGTKKPRSKNKKRETIRLLAG